MPISPGTTFSTRDTYGYQMIVEPGGGGYSPMKGDRMCRPNGWVFEFSIPIYGYGFERKYLELGVVLDTCPIYGSSW